MSGPQLRGISVIVIRALHLPDSDWGKNDKTDAYVEVQVGKQTVKTRTINDNLNPVWDERFNLPASLSDNVIFRVYDKDFLINDFLGSVTIPLAQLGLERGPFHRPVGILAKNNKPAGELLVRIEPDFGPPSGQFGPPSQQPPFGGQPSHPQGFQPPQNQFVPSGPPRQVRIDIVRAQGLPKADLIGKSDPYAILKIGATTHRTATKNNTHDPVWEQSFNVTIQPSDTVEIIVKDSDMFNDDILGAATLPGHEILSKLGSNSWVSLHNPKKNTQAGRVHLAFYQSTDSGAPIYNQTPSNIPTQGTSSLGYNPAINYGATSIPSVPFGQPQFFPHSHSVFSSTSSYIPTPSIPHITSSFPVLYPPQVQPGFNRPQGPAQGPIVIKILSARWLKNSDLVGRSDPYVQLRVGNVTHRTSTKPNTLDPVWDESFNFDLQSNDVLQISVVDSDTGRSADDLIGTATVNAAELFHIAAIDQALSVFLKDQRGRQSGGLLLLNAAIPGTQKASITSSVPTQFPPLAGLDSLLSAPAPWAPTATFGSTSYIGGSSVFGAPTIIPGSSSVIGSTSTFPSAYGFNPGFGVASVPPFGY